VPRDSDGESDENEGSDEGSDEDEGTAAFTGHIVWADRLG
jgi:hypothetical protein